MKLYSAALSPFAARARVAIYHFDLPVEIVSPPGGGTKSEEYLAINPIGKIPALVLDDGTVIPESDTIVEYLADAFPAKGLRPADPKDAARARLIARISELYVMNEGAVLFGQMHPKVRKEEVVDGAFKKLADGLVHLNHFLTDEPFAAGPAFSTADCCLAAQLFWYGVFGQVFAKGDIIAPYHKLARYAAGLMEVPAVAKIHGEMGQALAAIRGG